MSPRYGPQWEWISQTQAELKNEKGDIICYSRTLPSHGTQLCLSQHGPAHAFLTFLSWVPLLETKHLNSHTENILIHLDTAAVTVSLFCILGKMGLHPSPRCGPFSRNQGFSVEIIQGVGQPLGISSLAAHVTLNLSPLQSKF